PSDGRQANERSDLPALLRRKRGPPVAFSPHFVERCPSESGRRRHDRISAETVVAKLNCSMRLGGPGRGSSKAALNSFSCQGGRVSSIRTNECWWSMQMRSKSEALKRANCVPVEVDFIPLEPVLRRD